MKEAIWSETRAEIKRLYDAMPDSHKSQAKEIAASKLSLQMAAIREAQEKFDAETSTQQQAYWSRRYIALQMAAIREAQEKFDAETSTQQQAYWSRRYIALQMAAIREAQEKFDAETSTQQQAYWSRRYIALHKQLFRAISIQILTGSVTDSMRLPRDGEA